MMHLYETHDLVYHIEEEIKLKIPNSDVTIHPDPCYKICPPPNNDCKFLHQLKPHHHPKPADGTIPDDI